MLIIYTREARDDSRLVSRH